jgi:hypothetical protein
MLASLQVDVVTGKRRKGSRRVSDSNWTVNGSTKRKRPRSSVDRAAVIETGQAMPKRVRGRIPFARAPVAQRIERRFPKPGAQVRLLAGAPHFFFRPFSIGTTRSALRRSISATRRFVTAISRDSRAIVK